MVGILAPGFSGTTVGAVPELFLPLGMGDQLTPFRRSRLAWDSRGLAVYMMVARLKPGVDRGRTEAAARVLYQRLLDEAVARGARAAARGSRAPARPPTASRCWWTWPRWTRRSSRRWACRSPAAAPSMGAT